VNDYPTRSRFETTSWTLVVNARSSKADMESLLARYWSPIYAWFRGRGHDSESAADLTQAFLCDVVLKRDLIGRADPARGGFRKYLFQALRNFEVDAHRRDRGRDGRRARTLLPADPAAWQAAEPCTGDDPARAFERQWAAAVFHEALMRTERACCDNGMARHWRAFEARCLHPILYGADPTSIDQLADELHAETPLEISSLLHSAKRRFRAELLAVIAETIDDGTDSEQELAALRDFLSQD